MIVHIPRFLGGWDVEGSGSPVGEGMTKGKGREVENEQNRGY